MSPLYRSTIVLLLALGAASQAQAQTGEVYGHVGTEGLGIGYSHSLTPQAGVRIEGNYGRITRDIETDGVKYDAKIRVGGVGVLGDWFPADNGFRLSGGLTVNDKKGNGTGRSAAESVTLNGRTYSLAGEELRGSVKFPTVMPYLGIGWGHHAASTGWGFTADLGILIGKAKAQLSATPGLQQQAGADIEAERRELQREADKFKVYPILKVGVSYRF